MGAGCAHHEPVFDGRDPAFRRALLAVIAINAGMFLIEMPMGFVGASQALKADALDFLGDTVTYAMSLAVIGSSIMVRSAAAMIKGISLSVMGLGVLGLALYRVFVLAEPAAPIMGTVAVAALTANLASVLILMRFRDGDSNVRSVWLCSRNDAIGNVAVLIAAGAVWLTGTRWPDLIVAGFMASLFLLNSVSIVRQAHGERQSARLISQPGE